ncbi:MAG: HNH endonuclease [Candidatus Thorarchaeota archaeon]
MATLKYMIDDAVFGVNLLDLLSSKHIDEKENHFLSLAKGKGRLKSPSASWSNITKRDTMTMKESVKEYIASSGNDVSKAFMNLTEKDAQILLSKFTETTMIEKTELTRLFKELNKPRKELNGKSHHEDRMILFAKKVVGLDKLLSKKHLPHLTLAEAETIFLNAASGTRRQRKWYDVDKRFLANGIQKIRENFQNLLYGKDELDKRFDKTISNLDQVSTDLASTLLHLIDPTVYTIWNKPIPKGLEMIGRPLPKIRKENDGRRYERLIGIIRDIADEYGFKRLDIVDSLIYLIDKGTLKIRKTRTPKPKQRMKTKPKVKPPKKGGIPEKVRVETSAYKRDEKIVKYVKDAEYWTCQVCDLPIISPMGKYYCEAHHIQPLNKGGADDASNVLCLCPNHHAEMHNGLFYIEPHSKRLIYHNKEHEYHGTNLSESRNPEAEFHHTGVKYLQYHRDLIFRKK